MKIRRPVRTADEGRMQCAAEAAHQENLQFENESLRMVAAILLERALAMLEQKLVRQSKN